MQMLGGILGSMLFSFQVPASLKKQYHVQAPLGVANPPEEFLTQALITEIIAVTFIHLVRLAVIVDNRGNKVTS